VAVVTNFRLDPSYRRYDRVVIAGSPLRLFRLSTIGARVAEAMEHGDPLPEGHSKLTDRLVDAGAVHPIRDSGSLTAADVTVVVPAFNSLPDNLENFDRVIVVDDGSQPPLATGNRNTTIRLDPNRGPAAARNAGLAEVDTALVAFLDTDVDAAGDWLQPLLGYFDDPRVALVAPRVRSTAGTSHLAMYESARSPLDLGDQPARVAAGTRVSYVTGAALFVRTEALRAIGGFDDTLRVGEDVDAVWRLIDAGYRCRYEPSAVVHHRPRSTLSAWIRQRVRYGRSAATLDRRHPRAVTPLRISGWSAVVWALILLRRPGAAVLVGAGTVAALRRKLHDIPADESIRLAGLGHLHAGRQVAGAITRVWWPLAVVLAVFVPRLRLSLAAAALAPPVLDWMKERGPDDLPRYVALRVADDLAYGTGVWIGVVHERRSGALAPNFSNWPGRTAG
jgi:mycofactocin system glycosyltransferase